MANTSFNNQAVMNLMTMLDDHKDEIKEGDYMQMCNALKCLHINTNRPPRPQQPTQPTHTPTPVQLTPRQQRLQQLQRREIDIVNITETIVSFQNQLLALKVPPNTVRRNHKTLIDKCNQFNITIDEPLHKSNSTSVKLLETIIKNKGVSEKELKQFYLIDRRNEKIQKSEHIQLKINELKHNLQINLMALHELKHNLEQIVRAYNTPLPQ